MFLPYRVAESITSGDANGAFVYQVGNDQPVG